MVLGPGLLMAYTWVTSSPNSSSYLYLSGISWVMLYSTWDGFDVPVTLQSVSTATGIRMSRWLSCKRNRTIIRQFILQTVSLRHVLDKP